MPAACDAITMPVVTNAVEILRMLRGTFLRLAPRRPSDRAAG
jgi:hypothetical protein